MQIYIFSYRINSSENVEKIIIIKITCFDCIKIRNNFHNCKIYMARTNFISLFLQVKDLSLSRSFSLLESICRCNVREGYNISRDRNAIHCNLIAEVYQWYAATTSAWWASIHQCFLQFVKQISVRKKRLPLHFFTGLKIIRVEASD